MITRRDILKRSALLAGAAALTGQTALADSSPPPEIRIGYQKSSILAMVRAQGLVEQRYGASSKVSWNEFQFGPPLLEAMNAGRIEYGYTGNAPPVFAQAARAEFLYVAALPARGDNQAILVAKNSPLQQIVDLKGRKVAVGKGSSGHEFLLAVLDSAGLSYDSITPVYLAPADGAAALARGAVDAWSIWDPYLAVAQTKRPIRTLPLDRSIGRQNAFFLASKTFVETHPDIVRAINADIVTTAKWARGHRPEAVQLFAKATGVDVESETLVVGRSDFVVSPMTDKIIVAQQGVADRFLKAGLIPHPVNVREIAWLDPLEKGRPAAE